MSTALRGGAALALLLAAGLACAEAPTAGAHGPQTLRFETDDGFALEGDLFRAADPEAPAAILLHMYGSDRRAWAPLVTALREADVAVLALDQRAHGASVQQQGRTVRVQEIPRERFGAVVREGPRDVAAARRQLEAAGLAPRRLFLVGASYGCTVALLSAQRSADVAGLVLLSPGTSYFGVDVVGAAREFPGPMLIVAAEDDPRSAESARRLADAHPGAETLEIFPTGGHGTNLFPRRPELIPRIAEFLIKPKTR